MDPKLASEGLELEYQDLYESQDNETEFVKIHVPGETLARIAEINRIKVPLQKSDLGTIHKLPGTFGGVYDCYFLLHDGGTKIDEANPERKPTSQWPLRPWLYEVWARPGRWNKYQPIDQIREYFGEKIGMYFAWLGFYTTMLIPLTVLGMFFFIWSLFIAYDDPIVKDVCDRQGDNSTTVILALATAFWAVFFLEFWKREEARLACKWDTYDLGFEYEAPRPEYQHKAKEKRRHPITREWEPYVSTRSRAQKLVLSLSTVAFLICVLISLVIAVIIYKIGIVHKLRDTAFDEVVRPVRVLMVVYFYDWDVPLVDVLGSGMITIGTASCINATCMVILEAVYSKGIIILKLRDTCSQVGGHESYTYKTYIFQFINYYALLFYYAFIQANTGSTPANSTIYTDHCEPVGCSFSVTTQLCVVLILKQVLTDIKEIGVPVLQHRRKLRKHKQTLVEGDVYARFEKDYDLPALPPLGLLPEYLEMALQYGFVVMFGAVFPLAPFFALLNNIVEIRIDAYKFVACCRRPVPLRSNSIGTWYSIIEIGIILILRDTFSQFVYTTAYSPTGTSEGFVNFTLSYFNTSEWVKKGFTNLQYDPKFGNVTSCRYRGYYDPPGHQNAYGRSLEWWKIMFGKFAFVVVFQNIMYWVQNLIQYIIPDVPDDVDLHLQRNRYVSKAAAHKLDKEKEETKRRLHKASTP